MEVPLPNCFATLRKRVDGYDTDDSYHCVSVVLGWQDGSPNCIQNFEHHIFSGASGQAILLYGPRWRALEPRRILEGPIVEVRNVIFARGKIFEICELI